MEPSTGNIDPNATPRRGLLDIKITLSDPSPTAGTQFTLNVLVTNLFDVPIWPESPQVFLPSELQTISPRNHSSLIQSLDLFIEKAAQGGITLREDLLQTRPNWWQRTFPGFFKFERAVDVENALKELAGQARELSLRVDALDKQRQQVREEIAKSSTGRSFAELSRAKEEPEVKRLLGELASLGGQMDELITRLNVLRDLIFAISGSSAIISEGNLELQNFTFRGSLYVRANGNLKLDSLAQSRVVVLDSSLRPGESLQPGNTVVYSLALRTQSTLLFKPTQFSLQHSINFSFEKERKTINTNTASQVLTIRAPIWAVMWGSVVGGTAGFCARFLQEAVRVDAATKGVVGFVQPFWYYALFGVLTAILSAIAIVFLARKSETQAMVSVEDFWGGLVVGFLVGYTGTAAFESLANIVPAGPPAVAATNVVEIVP